MCGHRTRSDADKHELMDAAGAKALGWGEEVSLARIYLKVWLTRGRGWR